MSHEYSTITEQPAQAASKEQLDMLLTRYSFAASYCQDKDVIEVACGAGMGLGFLQKRARRIAGGDADPENLDLARRHYGLKIPLLRLDAHAMPLRDESLDVIVFFEALYYLSCPEDFFRECHRILRPEGRIVISTVNREWADFNPSPFSKKYFSARELSSLVLAFGFRCQMYSAFSAERNSAKKKVLSVIKRGAMSLGLIPKTMKGKAFLKRIFYGKLKGLPSEITDDMATNRTPSPLPAEGLVLDHKVLYLVAQKESK